MLINYSYSNASSLDADQTSHRSETSRNSQLLRRSIRERYRTQRELRRIEENEREIEQELRR
jgi:hypothetical protein